MLCAHLLEYFSAYGVSVAMIKLVELIDADKQATERFFVALAAGYFRRQAFVEIAPVIDSGQAID